MVRTTRELQRLDSITKSPIYAHFGETLNGLPTLRAYGLQDEFTRRSHAKVDANTQAFLLLNMINRWLGVRLELLGALVTVAIALLVNWMHASASLSGLVLTYAQAITQLLNWAVRANIDTENLMNSVERTDEYAQIIGEASVDNSYSRCSSVSSGYNEVAEPSWPQDGAIEFDNVSARYVQ